MWRKETELKRRKRRKGCFLYVSTELTMGHIRLKVDERGGFVTEGYFVGQMSHLVAYMLASGVNPNLKGSQHLCFPKPTVYFEPCVMDSRLLCPWRSGTL